MQGRSTAPRRISIKAYKSSPYFHPSVLQSVNFLVVLCRLIEGRLMPVSPPTSSSVRSSPPRLLAETSIAAVTAAEGWHTKYLVASKPLNNYFACIFRLLATY